MVRGNLNPGYWPRFWRVMDRRIWKRLGVFDSPTAHCIKILFFNFFPSFLFFCFFFGLRTFVHRPEAADLSMEVNSH